MANMVRVEVDVAGAQYDLGRWREALAFDEQFIELPNDEWGLWPTVESGAGDTASLSFSTKWSPPVDALKSWAEHWPTLTFNARFHEEFSHFWGTARSEAGTLAVDVHRPAGLDRITRDAKVLQIDVNCDATFETSSGAFSSISWSSDRSRYADPRFPVLVRLCPLDVEGKRALTKNEMLALIDAARAEIAARYDELGAKYLWALAKGPAGDADDEVPF